MRASDSELLRWAREKGFVVLTHDLDFGLLLSMTQEGGPSVVQVRTQDVTPEAIGAVVIATLSKHADSLDHGALLSIQGQAARVRILPISGSRRNETG
jgi:predicted nuclease of predicted toxin-antitoxin system